MTSNRLYADRAVFYDAIYHWKDYPAEAERVRQILSQAGVSDGSRILEAACGTGNYLKVLRETHRVAGFDLSESMLAVAREKLPDVPLWRADLISFAVREPFDALLCLFSSIGYVHGEERLARAARRCASAVRPGGVLILEPFVSPPAFRPGTLTMQTYDGDELKLCRCVIPRLENELAVLDFHWLALRKGAPEVEHFVEQHKLWLYPKESLLAVFEAEGFDSRFEPDGLMKDRGLLIGRRRDGPIAHVAK